MHDDLFWQLRTGQWIVAHHRVPLTDLFSYTRAGARWITHEWGFALGSYFTWAVAGLRGLVALTPILTAAICAAVIYRARDLAGEVAPVAPSTPSTPSTPATPLTPSTPLNGAGRSALLAVLVALGLWAASPELFLRAALVGELMLALVLAAVTRYQRTGRRRWLAVAAGLFLPWANLHSGVLFGLFVLALYAAEGVRAGAAAARPWLWTLAAALALTLVNPNGLAAPLYPVILSRILFASGIPWDLGHFSSSATAGAAVNAPLWLLLVLLLLALLPLQPPRPLQPTRRLSLAEAAAIASFALLSGFSHRFVFDLVVIGLPTLYKLLAVPPEPPEPSVAGAAGSTIGGRLGLAGRPGLAAVFGALLLLPVAPGVVAGTAASWARRPAAAGGLIAEHLPAAAMRFVAASGIAGPADRVFNHQNYGGFIGWRLGVPVFWDGRNDVFAELVRESATTPFGTLAARYGFDYLVIAEHDYPGIAPAAAAGRWGLVYWDDFCAVYLRRGSRYAATLASLELRLFPPFGGRPGLRELAGDSQLAAAARRELAQLLAAEPANQRALYFAGLISLYRGELDRAAAELRAARAVRPAPQVDEALEQVARIRRLMGLGG